MAWLWLLLLGPCCLSYSSGSQDFPAPLYNLSLDLPPEQRWEPVLKHYNYSYVREAMNHVFDKYVPKWVHYIIRPLAEVDLALLLHEPYVGEIKGIARTLGISIGDVVLLNLCYEATAFCTSIIAQDKKGNIYHGRNLDYNLGEILRNLTLDLHFIRNGQIAYTGTTFLGYVGLWTGQSPYKFTVSGDSRDIINSWEEVKPFFHTRNTSLKKCDYSSPIYLQTTEAIERGEWWENAISAFLKRSSPVSWLIRDTLNDAMDFQSAALKLSKTPIIAEVYYIMAGTKPREGIIITRNRGGPEDIWPLDPLKGQWFHVETNYDHWTTPPPSDDRRSVAIKAMNATGEANINTDTLYKVLSVRPVLNQMTIYTTVMSAAFPEKYTTRIRNEV